MSINVAKLPIVEPEPPDPNKDMNYYKQFIGKPIRNITTHYYIPSEVVYSEPTKRYSFNGTLYSNDCTKVYSGQYFVDVIFEVDYKLLAKLELDKALEEE